ncbi:MAG: hypothetical protein AAF840_06525, partial [Bacteroidota bacterium]
MTTWRSKESVVVSAARSTVRLAVVCFFGVWGVFDGPKKKKKGSLKKKFLILGNFKEKKKI